MIKFRSVLDRYDASELNQIEAADLLGVTERTFRRWCHRYQEDGEAGLLDRRLGRVSAKRVPAEPRLGGRSPVPHALQRFHRQAFPRASRARAPVHLGLHLDEAVPAIEGLPVRAETCGAHRRKRPWRPLPGMMLHQDGCVICGW